MPTTCRPRADQVHDLTRRINAEPTGPTIEAEMIERQVEQIRTLREALTQFVAACDTAPPISFVTEIGMACDVARAALAATGDAR